MSRIFIALAVVSILLLITALSLGLLIGPYNPLYKSLIDAEEQLRVARPTASSAQVTDAEQEIEHIYLDLQTPRRRARWHMLVGILATLVVVLVNSISVTYFIGTNRWCKEVVDTYELNQQMVVESTQLKRRSFPCSFASMLVILIIVALGAAADPGTLRPSTDRWVLPHFAMALGGGAFIAWSFYLQAGFIYRNSEIVEGILQQVRTVRTERGLDVE